MLCWVARLRHARVAASRRAQGLPQPTASVPKSARTTVVIFKMNRLRARRKSASALMLTAFVAMACQRKTELPPLPPAPLDARQAQALERMNAAGALPFAGWTWRYEFGAGCKMRVIRHYEDHPTPVNEYVLVDQVIEIVPYADAGFGVKAYPRAKPGSAGLFDARDEAQAQAFATEVRQLLGPCSQPSR